MCVVCVCACVWCVCTCVVCVCMCVVCVHVCHSQCHLFFNFQCEKIRKKRSTIIDTFRLANSSALEDASIQMNKAM